MKFKIALALVLFISTLGFAKTDKVKDQMSTELDHAIELIQTERMINEVLERCPAGPDQNECIEKICTEQAYGAAQACSAAGLSDEDCQKKLLDYLSPLGKMVCTAVAMSKPR